MMSSNLVILYQVNLHKLLLAI